MIRYYARLNENEVCTEIISTQKDLSGLRDFVRITDYNEGLLYRKWDGEQWSENKYEPTIETQLQEEIDELKRYVFQMGEDSENIKHDIEMSNAMMSMEILNAITGLESKLDGFINKPEDTPEEPETEDLDKDISEEEKEEVIEEE